MYLPGFDLEYPVSVHCPAGSDGGAHPKSRGVRYAPVRVYKRMCSVT
jgi:hypothetical protein